MPSLSTPRTIFSDEQFVEELARRAVAAESRVLDAQRRFAQGLPPRSERSEFSRPVLGASQQGARALAAQAEQLASKQALEYAREELAEQFVSETVSREEALKVATAIANEARSPLAAQMARQFAGLPVVVQDPADVAAKRKQVIEYATEHGVVHYEKAAEAVAGPPDDENAHLGELARRAKAAAATYLWHR